VQCCNFQHSDSPQNKPPQITVNPYVNVHLMKSWAVFMTKLLYLHAFYNNSLRKWIGFHTFKSPSTPDSGRKTSRPYFSCSMVFRIKPKPHCCHALGCWLRQRYCLYVQQSWPMFLVNVVVNVSFQQLS